MGAKEYFVKLDELITARDNLLKHPDAYFGLSTAKEVAEALDYAIAGMQQTPFAWTDEEEAEDVKTGAYGSMFNHAYIQKWTGPDSQWFPLFRHPVAPFQPNANPFIYGIEEPDGTPYMAEFCVSSDPGLLADEIRDMNADIPDGEPKYRVVKLVNAGEVQS